jgi:hypothetical protein
MGGPPDPLLLRKICYSQDSNPDLWIYNQELWPLYNWGSPSFNWSAGKHLMLGKFTGKSTEAVSTYREECADWRGLNPCTFVSVHLWLRETGISQEMRWDAGIPRSVHNVRTGQQKLETSEWQPSTSGRHLVAPLHYSPASVHHKVVYPSRIHEDYIMSVKICILFAEVNTLIQCCIFPLKLQILVVQKSTC